MGMSDTPENTHVYASNSRGNGITLNHYYEPLLGYDQKGEWRVDLALLPLLAEFWQQPNDTTYLFKIRQGAKWQDGRPFSVDDALWSLNYMPIVSQRLFHVIRPWVYDYRTGRSTQADLNGTTPFTWIDVDKLPSGRK